MRTYSSHSEFALFTLNDIITALFTLCNVITVWLAWNGDTLAMLRQQEELVS